jgi:hypothetical protein
MLPKFVIPLAGTATDHALRIAELDSLLESRPDRLLLILTGSGGLQPDAVMAYLDLLSRAECEIAVVSYGNLYGADFALWLGAGAIREIRPHAWVYIPAPDAEPDDGTMRVSIAEMQRPVTRSWDYQNCLDVISEHVCLDLIFDRRLSADDLRELLLLPSDDLDRLLPSAEVEDHLLPDQRRPPTSNTKR